MNDDDAQFKFVCLNSRDRKIENKKTIMLKGKLRSSRKRLEFSQKYIIDTLEKKNISHKL